MNQRIPDNNAGGAVGADGTRLACAGALSAPKADTSLSNTVSDKYNSSYFMPLRWGIDSLYLSFKGALHPEQQAKLESLKVLAQSDFLNEQAKAQIKIREHIFEVKDKGAGRFPFVLDDNCFRIQLSRITSSSLPMAFVKISSEYLTHKPIADIVEDLNMVLYELGALESAANVSRIDLFADFSSTENMESWSREAWVTRSEKIYQYAVKGVFSGWSIGMGAVMSARLYNKVLEIIDSKKEYLIPLWQAAGWDNQATIWRLEFEIKRDVLKQFDVQGLHQTLPNLNGLWSYATTEWLRLTIPNTQDSNRSRWELHPLWVLLSSVDIDTPGGTLTRNFTPERMPEMSRILRMTFASLTSYMAREKITDYELGAKLLITDLYHHINNHAVNIGTDFDGLVNERVAAKARKFNTILNNQPKPDSYTSRDYRSASDGDVYEDF